MSDKTTKTLLRPFVERAPAPMFLSSYFKSPLENFHNSETVEIDIRRDGENVAVPIPSLAAGRRYNENSAYSNKEYKPPVFKEAMAVHGFQLIDRNPGQVPFASVDARESALMRTAEAVNKLHDKIRRSIELMASQVLQVGAITLVDSTGALIYGVDFEQKTSHRETVGTAWALDGSTGAPLDNLADLADVVRRDGRRNPDTLVFGSTAWQRFKANADVQEELRRDGLGLGTLSPMQQDNGATKQGVVMIGSYAFDVWTYNGHFVHPQTTEPQPYVATDRVLMLSQRARLDLTFGMIPKITESEGQALSFIPSRVQDSGAMVDMAVSAWLSDDRETLTVQVGTRPLTIPTEIDSFASLDVVP